MSLSRLAVGALLSTGLAVTTCVGTYWTAQAMQTNLTEAAQATLQAHQLDATVVFSGRDAYVWADTPTARADAVAALRTIPGVRVVVIGEGAPPVTARSMASSTPSAGPSRTPLPATSSDTPSTTVSASTTAAAGLPSASEAVSTSAQAIPTWPEVYFNGDSSTVDTSGKAELLQVAQYMLAHPSVKLLLTGYTDLTAPAAARQTLGLDRAQSAMALVVANGVSPSRIAVASGGGNDPVASNDTSQGRALNRRVTVTMTQES